MAKLSEEEKERRAVNRRRKAALAAEADAIRHDDKRREWAENGTRLTRAELEAGVACRGCGLAIIDGLGDRPALMKMTDEERLEHEAAEAAFMARHPDCHAIRWAMSGSRTTHCGYCCPPPPLSKKQIEGIQSILTNAGRPDPRELDAWRLSLTCEHVVDKTQHSSNTCWSGSTTFCTECSQTRGLMTSEKLPPSPVRYAAESRRLVCEIQAVRDEYEKHQKKADTVGRRLAKLESEFEALGLPRTSE